MKKEDLIAGETVLVQKSTGTWKHLYLGCAGLVHFISVASENESYKSVFVGQYLIEQLNELFTIEQPQSKVVPLEKKVYNFVPVRVRDKDVEVWKNSALIAVIPNDNYPYKTSDDVCGILTYKYCEFI